MQISGNSLPVLFGQQGLTSQDSRSRDEQALGGYRDSSSQARNRQATEYVFNGDVLDDVLAQQDQQAPYAQVIDPANASAISSYQINNDNESLGGRRAGLIVDIYI